jgi:hypothetical protein
VAVRTRQGDDRLTVRGGALCLRRSVRSAAECFAIRFLSGTNVSSFVYR